MRIASAVFFALILIAAILKERENLVDFFIQSGPITLMLNLLTLTVGFFLARVFLLSKRQSITIAIESGIQNGTLGITIAATLLVNSTMTIPSAIYGLLMFGTAGLVILWGSRKLSTQDS